MKFNSIAKGAFVLGATLLLSCSSDDDTTPGIVEPATYNFTRNNESTVSFSGQTTRILMAEELAAAFLDPTATEAELDAMFAHQQGDNDFSDADLNASDKNILSKTAASRDFFFANTVASADIKADYQLWIANQVSEVFPNWNTDATAGQAGAIQEAGGGPVRYVNAEGVEYNQLFTKSLIGALMLDQALNNYLSSAVLDEADNIENNNNGITAEGRNYTTMEHKWDEAYGYFYGTAADPANPNATIGQDDGFMNKYIGRAENDSDFAGIAADIFNAFKLGRAAIVAKDYTVRDAQAEIIREKASEIIGIRAVYYLQQGKLGLEAGVVDYASVFHDLSEGLGFIYALQFTRRPGTTQPYFTKTEVEDFITTLVDTPQNGFWNVTPATLQTMSETIAAEFNFTIEEAAN
ncbi:DUF4856 domain-containing protein [Aquimarina brevivitae]|uniref:Uncharacterized protein DUF4856 n=1 Tax=Aquimarina brevivitae TaxID=323412 RepID=A0A4V2F5K8_9FLAO|nr:DUF4856 domain-containing protein [Aquimarina brevivitae]RZS93169.1 uncharacterized protein DUF4856 [Aquimarina brevivitae]